MLKHLLLSVDFSYILLSLSERRNPTVFVYCGWPCIVRSKSHPVITIITVKHLLKVPDATPDILLSFFCYFSSNVT